MLVAHSLVSVMILGMTIFPAKYGRSPEGARKERIQNSPNYRDGSFQNLNPTPQLTSDKGFLGTSVEFLFKKVDRLRPDHPIPTAKVDLHNLNPNEDLFVWFGHSSYLIQVNGKRILVDPIFSKAASPVFFVNKAFKGTNVFTADDMPPIDYLIISHDHWDHLDYPTVKAMKPKIGKVICGLGVGEHFERWKFPLDSIVEMDWNESVKLDSAVEIFCLPARHFSGRKPPLNQSLWASFLVSTPDMKIYIGGDGGYDTHFAEIGERFGQIDVAILEDGQYGEGWKYIHMMPEQVVQAAKDLKAKVLLPVHNSKYALAQHAWDDPLNRLVEAYDGKDFQLLTPMIGEQVALRDSSLTFDKWWKK